MAALIAFVQAHMSVVVGLIVAILDLVMALMPSLQSNGILHAVYLWLKKLAGSQPPQA